MSNHKEITFPLADRKISLTVIKDVESLITDTYDEDKVPCWAEIWPAAQGLANWIWNYLSFNEETLLELGCGLGLPGIVCGLKGARVTFSDFNSMALEMASYNAFKNGLSDYSTYLGDWRQFELDKIFDWLLLSDVTYHPLLNQHLLDIVKKNLAVGGNILVSHPGRHVTFNFMEHLDNLASWNKYDTQISITVDDPLMPYQNIYIHYWQRTS